MMSRVAFSTATTVVAICLESSGAHAFCRAVSASPPAGYDPTVDGCYAPSSGPDSYELYWKNLCVGYSVQKDASPLRSITLDQATQVAGQAFSQWTGAGCTGGVPSIQARDLGPVECGLVQYNSSQPNQHVIVFRDDGWPYSDSNNTLGLTTITFDATTGEIFDADTELNSHDYNLVTSTPAPFGSYDLASVLTHEAGHFLGLAHSGDTAAVMYAHYHPASSTLTSDDVDGICSAYPDGTTRTTSAGALAGGACDPTPRHGFSTKCASSSDAGVAGDGGAAPASGRSMGGTAGASTSAAGAAPSSAPTSAPSRSPGAAASAPTGSRATVVSGPASMANASGPPGAATSSPGNGPSTPARTSCLVGVGAGSGSNRGWWWLPALLTAALWLRRPRRRNGRPWIAAGCIALGITTAGASAPRDAGASVSIAVLFDELVRDSSAVAKVTPLEQRTTWENGRICTYTRVRVDALVAGELDGDSWIRTLGGVVGTVGQLVEGEPTFAGGRASLVFLRQRPDALEVVARAQGQFALVPGAGETFRLVSASAGALLPPPPERIARAQASGSHALFARDVLHGRTLAEATRAIGSAWSAAHAR
jgi:hypothetical protein